MLNTILLQGAGAAGGNGWMTTLIFFGLFFAIIYFTMIAPQQKKQKKLNAFRDGLRNGDKVMTAGGIYGRIREIKDTYILLEIDNNVTIKIDKNSIYQSMQDVTESGTGVANK
jgi:preprotein translocase subunit YajC